VAWSAVDRGFDLYYSDGRRTGEQASAFMGSSCAAPFQAFLSGPQAHALGGNLYEFEPMTFLASYSPRGPKVGPIRRCAAMDASFFYSIKKEGDSRIFQAQDRAIE